MQSRRNILKMLAFGGTLFAADASGTAEVLAQPSDETRLPDGPEPWWLLHPLTEGSQLAKGWLVKGLSRVERGASILELVHPSGRQARIHICYRKEKPKVSFTLDTCLVEVSPPLKRVAQHSISNG